MSPKDCRPPRLAEKLLRRIFSDQGRYTHLGDFHEAFLDVCRERGERAARRWYLFHVLKSLPGFLSNKIYWSIAMLKNYLVMAFRNFVKNVTFSLINLAGLAVGLACFILILAFVRFELSYDRFHEKADRVFRVLSLASEPGQAVQYHPTIPEVLAPILKAEIPEITRTALVYYSMGEKIVLENEGRGFLEAGLFVDDGFLRVFSFPLVKGDAARALADPRTIVLTEGVARKMFPGADPIGKAVAYKSRHWNYDLTVTGVVPSPPSNSHLQFGFLVSIETIRADKKNDYMFNNWNVGNFSAYLELRTAEASSAVEAKFASVLDRHAREGSERKLALQPLRDIHLRSQIYRQDASNNEIRYVALFSAIAVVLLVIAGINYVNLTTARTSARAKEIGIRKVNGANRGQLFRQFIGESVVVALAATALALVFVVLVWPRFASLVGLEIGLGRILTLGFVVSLVLIAVLTGVLSGLYPAFILSSLRPVRTMREHASSGRRGGRVRSVLVVVQFGASLVLLIGTFAIWRQMNYIRSQNLGFDREHVVVIPIREKETAAVAPAIRQALLECPEVVAVSSTSGLPTGIRSRLVNHVFQRENGEKVKIDIRFDYVDENFLDVFKIEIAQGRNFSPEFGEDKKGVLLNEAAVRAIGWKDPVGQPVPFTRGKVIGVVKDFHFDSFRSRIEPMALMFSPGNYLAVRTRPGDLPRTIAALRNVFESLAKGEPFDYFFLDDAFDRLYKKEIRTGEIFEVFALLTVFIACLGLAGLAAYAVERRTKEIGIRKVLGASVPNLLALITKSFAVLLGLAAALAWPLAYGWTKGWLRDFAYSAGLSLWTFAGATAAVVLVAMATVGIQAFRAARADPVETLRYE